MNFRPAPPQGAPNNVMMRVYRRPLRPIILTMTSLGAIWAIFQGVSFFRGATFDRADNLPAVKNFCIALGALYMAIFLVEVLGVFASFTQRIPAIRLYAYLSIFSTLAVLAAGLTQTVMHFIFKNDLINTCTKFTDGDTIVYYGFWGPTTHITLNAADARSWCERSWSHGSWTTIVALLIVTGLGAFWTMVAFAYLRQMLDPTSVANASRTPQGIARLDNSYPSHYNPPYNASVPNLGYGYGSQPPPGGFAPPPGPPPRNFVEPEYEPYDTKPPGYTGSGPGYTGDKNDKDDPFADFESTGARREERDVTSRPGPGGQESFR